ncbi:MAG: hypothetical protein MUF85_00485 [Patescibacteria group bacterium]|jgi:hypothetical protein|nr:hypothetical protein [Patescibacteria group bacterium]
MKHETAPSNNHELKRNAEVNQYSHESKKSLLKKHENLNNNSDTIVDINSARKTAELHAKSIDQFDTNYNNPPKPEHHHYLTKTIKKQVYHQTVKDIQTHLSSRERMFSRLIHNDTVENISELASKTIARPSGILGGGIFMVIGGLIVLFIAKKIGFEIPYSLFLFLYIIGFVVFVIFDILYSPLKSLVKKR